LRNPLRALLFLLHRLASPALARLNIDTKAWYEFTYWRLAKWREGVLANGWYEKVFTDSVGVTRDHYRGKRVVDIGCGPRGSLEWAAHVAHRVGLDPLADRYRGLGIEKHQMSYVAARCEQTPFRDRSFDMAVAVNSLDHVDDLEASLAEIRRIVDVGGELMLITHVHDRPTVAEPTAVPWDLVALLEDSFEVLEEHRYELNPRRRAAVAALQTKIPFDFENPRRRYGVLFARLRRS
jgi:SAM-dependent methyltransferase